MKSKLHDERQVRDWYFAIKDTLLKVECRIMKERETLYGSLKQYKIEFIY